MLYGAGVAAWNHFSETLGLTADLLPVVSNPNANISNSSTLAGKGKVPSVYNAAGDIVGLAGWTQRVSERTDIRRWAAQDDYGICIQTRSVRAFDIDIDNPVADVVAMAIESIAGSLPVRTRNDSRKKLLAFRCDELLLKRVIRCDVGLIELLASGQQFVAAGTHTNGQRYQWCNGLPKVFPYLSLAQVNEIWELLCEKFAVNHSSTERERRRGDDLAVVDYVVDKLDVLGYGPDGQLHIACPFRHEHTTDSGPSATVYFPAGTNGYERGHFKCLHAHCAERTDHDFLSALGFIAEGLTEVAIVEPAEPPRFERRKDGQIIASAANVAAALRYPVVCGRELGYDTFRDEVVLRAPTDRTWVALKDEDYFALRLQLERYGFEGIGFDLIRHAVHWAARQNSFDSALEWLRGLVWDGESRVDTFLCRYFGIEDTPYTRAVSRYMWTALAGRCAQPGVKADMVVIFQGDQGLRKSTGIQALAPGEQDYVVVDLNQRDADISRRLRGKLVAELDELQGLQTRDLEGIKAFIAHTHDNWIPKYKEMAVTYARRVVFFGTTNKDDFLADETGNRRWLPVHVPSTRGVDLGGIAGVRDQLWAEGFRIFQESGVYYEQPNKLADEARQRYRLEDAWEPRIAAWLYEPGLDGVAPADSVGLTTLNIATGALGFDVSRVTRREEMRVSRIMRVMGWVQVRNRISGAAGHRSRVWERPDDAKTKALSLV